MANSTKDIIKQNTIVPESTRRFVENTLLVWVDHTIDKSNKDFQRDLTQFQQVINQVIVCTKLDNCVDVLGSIRMEKVFVILSNVPAQDLVSTIHSMAQINSIYILHDDQVQQEQWIKEWPKIKGLYGSITSICEAIQIDKTQCNQDFISMSFIPSITSGSNVVLNQLDPSFMYTQLFMNTLLEMKHNEQSLKDFVVYCGNAYADNLNTLQLINRFEHDYYSTESLFWYTQHCFIYEMLNRALRLLKADIIVTMGFFIQDLHRQIKHLHEEQLGWYHSEPFVVYRGQGLSNSNFRKLQMAEGGLMSFNCFLSTSKNRQVSLMFADRPQGDNETVGILFVMTIDPNITSASFADITSNSHFSYEEEILFSTNTVFRIREIKESKDKPRLFEVHLSLTSDDDEQLRTLTNLFEKDLKGGTGYERLGNLLIKVGQFDKAEELYLALLEQALTQSDKASYYHHLGLIKGYQEDYYEALRYHERSLSIEEGILPVNYANLAVCYNSIGGVYEKLKEYSKALSFHEKAFSIWKETLPENHSNIATSYNNIGSVYDSMKEYSKALSFYERALIIQEKILPPSHPDLADSYNNIGFTCTNMEDYSKAVAFYEKALSIWDRTLPKNHPSLITVYINLGDVYGKMGDYSKSLSFITKAISNEEEILFSARSDSIASNQNLGEYAESLAHLARFLNIQEPTVHETHPDYANMLECMEILKLLESL